MTEGTRALLLGALGYIDERDVCTTVADAALRALVRHLAERKVAPEALTVTLTLTVELAWHLLQFERLQPLVRISRNGECDLVGRGDVLLQQLEDAVLGRGTLRKALPC